MLVRDYMTVDVVTAATGDLARDAFKRMEEKRIRHLLVLGEGRKLLGILSDRDLRRQEVADDPYDLANYYVQDATADVGRLMTKAPVVVKADDSIAHAVALVLKGKFGALPVVDADGRVAGILSAVDLLRALADVLGAMHEG